MIAYADYMTSRAWQQKRLEYWRSGAYRECYVCGDPWVDFKGKELHHRTYDRLGDEDLDDLVPVCPEHHVWITELWVIELARPEDQRLTLWDVTEYVRMTYTSPVRTAHRKTVLTPAQVRAQKRDRRARAALKKAKKQRPILRCAVTDCLAGATLTAFGSYWCSNHDPNR